MFLLPLAPFFCLQVPACKCFLELYNFWSYCQSTFYTFEIFMKSLKLLCAVSNCIFKFSNKILSLILNPNPISLWPCNKTKLKIKTFHRMNISCSYLAINHKNQVVLSPTESRQQFKILFSYVINEIIKLVFAIITFSWQVPFFVHHLNNFIKFNNTFFFL